jgi:hypothetical protein
MPTKTRSQTKTTTQETPDEPRMTEFKSRLLSKIETYFEKWLWDIPAVRQAALDRAMKDISSIMLSPEELSILEEEKEYDLLGKLYCEYLLDDDLNLLADDFIALGGVARFDELHAKFAIPYPPGACTWLLDDHLYVLFGQTEERCDRVGKGPTTDCQSLLTEYSDLFHH